MLHRILLMKTFTLAKLNEMHITGKLSRVGKDIDKLKKKLLKDTYWNDEMIKMKYRNRIYKIC